MTVVYLEQTTETKDLAEWMAKLKHEFIGVDFVPLPRYLLDFPVQLTGSALTSYYLMLWLKSAPIPFSVVIFHDWRGAGYFPALAKASGHFERTMFVAGLHSPSAWSMLGMNMLNPDFGEFAFFLANANYAVSSHFA